MIHQKYKKIPLFKLLLTLGHIQKYPGPVTSRGLKKALFGNFLAPKQLKIYE